MSKPNFQFSVLDGIDFFISQGAEDPQWSNEDQSGCSSSDPFNLCMRQQMMMEMDWDDTEIL